MKIVFFDDNLIILDIYDEIENITVKTRKEIVWRDGFINGINMQYVILNDDFQVNRGDLLDVNIVLGQMKELLKLEVNESVNNACFKGFLSNITGWFYETEYHDQTNFSRRMLTLLNDQNKNVVEWKTADGVVREHTREQFLGVCNELDEFITSKVNAGWVIKNVDIENASSLEELKSINLNVE
ncbi:DUF4376 domain-containing protein [Priestia megaterium]|uniref:DUF4376 domain-containing protein n=1 Tax=Priestia megaterium TaxID=1404 RepID=UPI00211C726C|nr:hypothetical protein [Priestia megaterium]